MWKGKGTCILYFMRVHTVYILCPGKGINYLLSGLRSLISAVRKGRKAVPQNGQVLLRLESFAVQPAMISSSYTRQSHVLHSEQLDISTYSQKAAGRGGNEDTVQRKIVISLNQPADKWLVRVAYLYGVIGSGLEAAGVRGGIWSVRCFRGKCQTTWIWWKIIQLDT